MKPFSRCGMMALMLLSRDNQRILSVDPNDLSITEVATKSLFLNTETRVLNVINNQPEQVWICTTNGAFRWLENSAKADESQLFFPDKQVSCVVLDKENNLWFSTLQQGVMIVPNKEVLVYNQFNSDIANNRISSLGIAAVVGYFKWQYSAG